MEFKLENGKDYKLKNNVDIIIIDRKGMGSINYGFLDGFKTNLYCEIDIEWCDATEEDVIIAFEKECVKRYGKNWMELKVKYVVPGQIKPPSSNRGDCKIEIIKSGHGWKVWNKFGLLYSNGKWNEILTD